MEDDIQERPSKIRKLDPSNSPTPVSPSKKTSLPPQPLDPTVGETPFQSTDSTPATTPNPPQQPLSKSALKKLKRKEAWAASADDRRAKRREQHKEKQARKAAVRDELAAKIASGEIDPPPVVARPFFRPKQVPLGLVIDCDFEDKMNEKEIISLGSQLTRSYSENKTAKYRSHLCISSWNGILKQRFETELKNSHLQWKGVRFEGEDFIQAGTLLHEVMRGTEGGRILGALATGGEPGADDVQEEENAQVDDHSTAGNVQAQDAPVETATTEVTKSAPADTSSKPDLPTDSPPNIVYLSSDSPHTLSALSPYTTYIIGGIVDKNRHKGLCFAKAQELGIPTAKLPIGEYMTMNSRTVLTVNHVVEIMLKWLEFGDWGVAFDKVIPKRKGGILKEKHEKGDKPENDEDLDGDEVELVKSEENTQEDFIALVKEDEEDADETNPEDGVH